MVVKASNAPVFSLGDVDLGHGEVGGDVTSFAKEGELVGSMAQRVLRGERPQDIPIVNGANAYMFDWRALKRWSLDETKFPAGSIVLNKPLNIWEVYKHYIVAGILLLVLQALIIVGLLWQRAKRRKTETELRESEGRFRLVANTAPVMIWISGTDKLRTYSNQPWLEFTGRSLKKELGCGWTETVHPDDLGRCISIFTGAFKLRDSFQREYRLRRSDGEYRWILERGVPRFYLDGSFAGYIGSAIDVTEHKRAQAALAEVGQKLIAAHEEERMRLARELHDDICQRLAMISVHLDGLASTVAGSSEAEKGLGEAIRQVSELGSDIQALSHRLHSSKLEYVGLVRAVRAHCKELSKRHELDIEIHAENIPGHLPKEITFTLFRVLQEALQNAVKHSGGGDNSAYR